MQRTLVTAENQNTGTYKIYIHPLYPSFPFFLPTFTYFLWSEPLYLMSPHLPPKQTVWISRFAKFEQGENTNCQEGQKTAKGSSLIMGFTNILILMLHTLFVSPTEIVTNYITG